MKRRIDLVKAADGEAFGALAVGTDRRHRSEAFAGRSFTAAQSRVLRDLARSLVQLAREAGADHKRVTIGDVSFELRDNGIEEVLSIRTGVGS